MSVLGFLLFGAVALWAAFTFGTTDLTKIKTLYGPTVSVTAHDTERKTDINSLTNQIEAYYAKNDG